MKRWPLFLLAPTWIILVVNVLPLVLGQRTLFHSDVFNLHLGIKAATAQTLSAGELPLVDMVRTTGEPLLGNLNGLPLYPTNLLYLVAPVEWAFNAHYWLHWLLAPLAFYFMARGFGLGPGGASAAAVFWSTGGFFLSQLSFYNLIAVTALAPAFLGFWLGAEKRPAFWPLAALNLGLLVLAGDPFSVVITVAMGLLALFLRSPRLRDFPWVPVSLSLAGGALLALPTLVELVRIYPGSLRAVASRDLAFSLGQSLEWAFLADLLIPFVLGAFDMTFWSKAVFFEGRLPFLATIFPGFLVLAAALVGGHRAETAGDRWPVRWSWLLVLGGLFFALGENNPLVVLLYEHVPGLTILRFPVKFALPASAGLVLLAGIGFDRFLGDAAMGRRLLARIAAALTGFYGLGLFLLLLLPAPLEGWLRSLEPTLFAGPAFDRERVRWALTLLILTATGALILLCCRLARRSPLVAAALMLALASVMQLSLMGPLFAGTDMAVLREKPAALSVIPPDSLVFHHSRNSLDRTFERLPLHLIGPNSDALVARCAASELSPKIAAYFGRRFALAQTADYLDTYLGFFVSWRLQSATDDEVLSVLAILGVDRLLLTREIAATAAARVELLGRFPSPCERELFVYRLKETETAPYLLPGEIRRAGNLDEGFVRLAAGSFDARQTVLLSGLGEVEGRPPGTYRLIAEHSDGFELEAESAAGAVLVARRNYLPFYRAFVDGKPARLEVANLMHLGLELPPGRHHVRVEADRRPTRIAFTIAGITALLLLVAIFRPVGRPSAQNEEGGPKDPPSASESA